MREPVMNEEAIFEAAVEKSPEEREAYLRQACDDDDEQLGRLRALLIAHHNPDSFLNGAMSGGETQDFVCVTEKVGETIGP